MPSATPVQAVPVQLGTGNTLIYQCPSTKLAAVIRCLDICNTDSVPHTYRLFIVPNGSSPGAATAIAFDVTIPANESLESDKVRTFGPLGALYGLADTAAKVTVTAHPAEYV